MTHHLTTPYYKDEIKRPCTEIVRYSTAHPDTILAVVMNGPLLRHSIFVQLTKAFEQSKEKMPFEAVRSEFKFELGNCTTVYLIDLQKRADDPLYIKRLDTLQFHRSFILDGYYGRNYIDPLALDILRQRTRLL